MGETRLCYHPRAMQLSDFAYDLPSELIAQYPLEQRGASRLLCLDGATREDRRFADLPDLLCPGDLLVFNDTRVMPARLYGNKVTGGRVEILIERLIARDEALAHVRASKRPRPGSGLSVAGREIQVLDDAPDDLLRLKLIGGDFHDLMAEAGHVPLPPYIARADTAVDTARYQTVYAAQPGAVAAPTAGLHFDRELLQRLQAMGVGQAFVTLHVAAGTFQPVRAERLEDHRMHAEWLEVSEGVCEQVEQTRAAGGRVIAVGTTSVRSLETASANGRLRPFRGDTRLFIRPGYVFRTVDALLTNFHLPESTLLMLVTAFGGYAEVMAAYRHAVAARYRFFSYGDAMFLARRVAAAA